MSTPKSANLQQQGEESYGATSSPSMFTNKSDPSKNDTSGGVSNLKNSFFTPQHQRHKRVQSFLFGHQRDSSRETQPLLAYHEKGGHKRKKSLLFNLARSTKCREQQPFSGVKSCSAMTSVTGRETLSLATTVETVEHCSRRTCEDDDASQSLFQKRSPPRNYASIASEKVSKFLRKINPFSEHPTISNSDTIIHMLKGNIGTGILAMPDAIKNSGLLVGNLGLVLMAIICVHCMHLLVSAAERLKELKREGWAPDASVFQEGGASIQAGPQEGTVVPQGQESSCSSSESLENETEISIESESLTYPDVIKLTCQSSKSKFLKKFSSTAKKIVNMFLCLTQFGFCCVYVVFVAQNLKLVIDHHFGEINYHWVMLCLLPTVILLAQIRDLRYLSPISMLANILQFVGLAICLSYLIQDLPYTWERKLFSSWEQLPLYFGTAIYAFEGIGVILPLQNQMRHPEDLRPWNGVLNTSMSLVSILYVAVAFFGYLKYGDHVLGSVTLNLPVEERGAQICVLSMSLAIFFSYALQFYVPMEIMSPLFKDYLSHINPNTVELTLRTVCVAATFGLASAIPRLDLFISLVGALSSSALALILPPLIDTILFWDERKRSKKTLFKNFLILCIGISGLLVGSYFALKNIYRYFKSGK